MRKWECLGCGNVAEANRAPSKCDRCGDTVADNGGQPVFRAAK